MKNKVLPIVIILINTLAYAQFTPVPIIENEFPGAADAVIVNNDIYVTSLGVTQVESEIERVDLSSTTPIIEETLFHPDAFSIDIDGDLTYVAGFFGAISQVDTADFGNEVILSSTLDIPVDILRIDNFLYLTAGNRVSRIDLNNPSVIENLVDVNFPQGMVLIGNNLYITASADNSIVRIDITDTTPQLEIVATGFSNPSSLAASGNILYIGEFSGATSSIFSFDTENSNPVPVLVSESVGNVVGLSVFEDDLYFVGGASGTLFRLDNVLSTNDFTSNLENFEIYQNPSNGNIFFSDINGIIVNNIKVYSLTGQLISNNTLESNEFQNLSTYSLDVQTLQSGVYLIQVDTNIGVLNKKLLLK